jgi:hypothetical protein
VQVTVTVTLLQIHGTNFRIGRPNVGPVLMTRYTTPAQCAYNLP